MVSSKRKKLENAAIFNPTKASLKEDYKSMSAVEFLAYGGMRPPESEKSVSGSTLLIPLNEIEVCPQSSGRPSEPTDIEDLKQSIAENGLIQNIVVCLNAPGSKFKYRLIAGHRRRMACLSLGKTEIEAKVLDVNPEDLASIETVQLIENIQNKALTALEEARGLLSLHEKSGLSVRELSEKLGIPRTTLRDSLQIANWYSEWVGARAPTSIDDLQDEEVGARAPTFFDVEKLSRRCLLTIARVEKKEILPKILPKAEELSTRELEKLIKKEQDRIDNPSEHGPKRAKIGAGALIKAYYNEAIKSTANIKVDEAQLLEIQRQLDHESFAKTLEDVKTYAVTLCNLSISKLFPGKSFSIEMTIKVPDFERARKTVPEGSFKVNKNNINNTGYIFSPEETEVFNHINQELSKYENYLNQSDFAEALKKMSLEEIIAEYHLLPYRFGALPGILFRQALAKYGTDAYEKPTRKTKNKKFSDLKPVPGHESQMTCAICAGQGIIQAGPQSGAVCSCPAGDEIRKENHHG